jgi:hypothetical protein
VNQDSFSYRRAAFGGDRTGRSGQKRLCEGVSARIAPVGGQTLEPYATRSITEWSDGAGARGMLVSPSRTASGGVTDADWT